MKGRPDLIAPQDVRYIRVDPDPNFDPEHNQRVIEKTIKDNERLVRARRRSVEEKAKERINALATYTRSVSQGGKSLNYKKFFGENTLAYLRGEDPIARKYKALMRGVEVLENLRKQLVLQGRGDTSFVIKPSENTRSKVATLTKKGLI